MAESPGSLSSIKVVDAEEWRSSTDRFSGEWQGGTSGSGVCVIANHMEAGAGARMHRHPYPETFVIRRGRVVFDIGGEEIEGREGQIVVVPAGVPHAFRNDGPEPLEMIDIHENGAFDTEWL